MLDNLKLECCNIDTNCKTKDDVLKKIASIAKKSEIVNHITEIEIYKALKEREEQGSTGFGDGIAIPHCQIENLNQFLIVVMINKKGVDFESFDKKKSKIFVSIIGPKKDRNGHLQLLAQVSRILKEKNIRENLLKSETAVSIYEEIARNVSSEVDIAKEKGKQKLMLLVVKDEDSMDSIASTFIEYGIQEVTIVDSSQMDNLLSNVPLFLGFFNFTADRQLFNKVVIAKIDEGKLNAVIKGIDSINGDLNNHTGIAVMVLDLFYSKGIF